MIWQDTIIAITIISFSYALVPQVYEGFKTRKGNLTMQTSLITSAGMFTLAYIYATLNLFFSVITSLLTGILWSLLLIQKIVYK